MPRFAYRAWDQSGRLETGVLDAESPRVAAASLQARGYLITALTEQERGESAAEQVGRYISINRRDLVLFTRQLATMIAAGLPIVTALRVLEEQSGSRRLRDVIGNVRQGIERGGSLSGEIAKHPQAFFEFYVNTVRAGEVSGVLDTSLNYLADYLERELELVQRVRTAATYPLLVLTFTMLVAGGALIMVVPMFVRIFQSFRVPLPVITVFMVALSQLVRGYWWLGLILGAGAAVGFVVLRRTPAGRRVLDQILLRVPIMGPLILRLALARFGRAMAVVIRSGIPMLEGLTAVAGALGNQIIGDALNGARERMREGQAMAQALARSPVFPPMVIQMVRVGEETGAMEDVLKKVADYYEAEVDNTVKRFASIVEPVLIIGVGGVVALIALSVLMPIWTLVANIQR